VAADEVLKLITQARVTYQVTENNYRTGRLFRRKGCFCVVLKKYYQGRLLRAITTGHPPPQKKKLEM
jgi:hypothetical protein